MKEPIYVIDGYGQIYRSYFAFMNNPRLNPLGENSSAVYGFFLSFFSILRSRNPAHLVVAMDSRGPTFRHKQYPAYKEKRQKTPADLHEQVTRIDEILRALNVPVFQLESYEADDIIAAIARWCRREGYPCHILSKDKDLFQLVDEDTSILYSEKGRDFSEWKREEIFANKGVYPEQIVDFLSLSGDSSDNIPGVPGIGEKTAIKLLSDYKTLDNIYANLDKITAAAQLKKLREGKESAYLSRSLIRLDKELPLNFTIEAFTLGEPNRNKVIELFHRDGIKTFDKDLSGAGTLPQQEAASTQPAAPKGTYQLITEMAVLDTWIKKARGKGTFAFDIETDNIDDMLANPIGFSFSCDQALACYVPIRAVGVECLPEAEVKEKLRGLLEDKKLKLVGQNFKYDYKVLSRWGIRVQNVYFDTMLAAWVLDSAANSFNMDKLAEQHLNYTTIHYSDLIGKKEELTLADIEISKVTDYAAEDADITFRLYQLFSAQLEKEENRPLKELFYNLEMPLLTILADMELRGIKLLPKALESYSIELEKELQQIEAKIYTECGHEFNIRSTKELQVVLFEERKLQPVKKTKTGNSTDAQVLEILALEDPVAEMILKHRMLAKLKSTYVDTLPKLVNPATGRLHTSYLQTGTATGRLSSNNPNLQNIPVRDEEGRRIREAFVPAEGCHFLSADYSQIELVVLAHLAGEQNLSDAFARGQDIHRLTASLLFELTPEEVTPLQRRIGKTINFGVIYGMSGFRLSRDLKISRKEADRFIETYFQVYSGVNAFKERVIAEAEAKGFVETILGRRRKLLNINNRNKTVKMAEERIAVNTPIQGSAADIVKLAMLKIAAELKHRRLKTRLLLQVHDELILEVPENELQEVASMVKKSMEQVYTLSAPLKVNIEIRDSWGQIH